MLRKKYDIDHKFKKIVSSFGDMEEQMVMIERILADQKLFQLIETDFSKRFPLSTKTGRRSTPVEVILRMLALKHLRGLSYEKLLKTVNESLILRQFCRIYFNPLPHKSTLIRWSNQISQQALHEFNQRLTEIAIRFNITKGKKLRTDGTVVATNIHFPSDNSLLTDGIRVIHRILSQAKKLVFLTSKKVNFNLCRNHYRTARKLCKEIDSLSKTRNQYGQQKRKQAYIKLIEVVEYSLKQAEKIPEILQGLSSTQSLKLEQKCKTFIFRVKQVIEQTRRRILNREKVPASDKIVSLFEVHTAIICRGKINVDVEFGRKIWLDEIDGGIISNYRILKGNPHDTQQLIPSLEQHLNQFGTPPKTITADRGVYSQINENYAQQIGIKNVVLPKGGHRTQERINQERKCSFKQARRWHNGIEGRISFLKRSFGLQRCLYRGEEGFARWIGWGIIAHNLTKMSKICPEHFNNFLIS